MSEQKVFLEKVHIKNYRLLSNGTDSKVGSLTASWEHFAEWKRVHGEDEPPKVSLETILQALCEPQRLLEVIENFILFMEA